MRRLAKIMVALMVLPFLSVFASVETCDRVMVIERPARRAEW